MATHFSILAWEILWTEEPDRLQSVGLQRVRHNWVTLCTHTHTYIHKHTHTQRDDTFQISHIVRFNELLSESAWYLTGNISLLFLFSTFLWWNYSICLWLLAFYSFIYPASTWALSTGEARVGLEIRWWNVLGNVTALRVYSLVGDSGKYTGIPLIILPAPRLGKSSWAHVSMCQILCFMLESHMSTTSPRGAAALQLLYVSDRMIIQRKKWPFTERVRERRRVWGGLHWRGESGKGCRSCSGLWSRVPERALYLKDNNMKSYGSPGQWECCKEFSSAGV